jgi:hypothetical protein
MAEPTLTYLGVKDLLLLLSVMVGFLGAQATRSKDQVFFTVI